MDTSEVIRELDELITTLASPLSEDLLKDGWSEESAAGIRIRLETFRREIESLGDLPPIGQSPLGMVRALDFWGVQQGELVDELATFEHDLRRMLRPCDPDKPETRIECDYDADLPRDSWTPRDDP